LSYLLPMDGGRSAVPRQISARELQAVIHAEREGAPFFVFRDAEGEQRISRLGPGRQELTVGRRAAADLSFPWDPEVSGLHAQVQQLAQELTLVDDGLSRNGSYVNGERVHGRRRLRDGDRLRFGQTVVLVRKPADAKQELTAPAQRALLASHLSEQQRNVLLALCRPLVIDTMASPATNQEIADQLVVSVATVKLHLRALFEKFEITDLPQNSKRLTLAARALQSGLFTDQELAAEQSRR
jgi:pSer/pThr/pTyr-binding forkhead associated (FHA) protein